MVCINHTVEQLTTADAYTAFEGLETIDLTVILPDWHQPFPSQERIGAANPRSLKMVGLLHVSRTWYINGPVMDQWTVSTLSGPVQVPAGTRIETQELPGQWKALKREASPGKQEWWFYANGRTGFC